MIAAFFSAVGPERRAFASEFAERCGSRRAIYVCPKAEIEDARREPFARPRLLVPFEDLTKTETWLRAVSWLGAETALVTENVSRYPKITSEKVAHLQRLSMQAPHRCVVDVVPFTSGIEFLYTPFSYLDRSLLGFSHWYAFRENNFEQLADGSVVRSHDPRRLADKARTVTVLGSRDALLSRRSVLLIEGDAAEADRYAELRERLFDANENPVRLVTQLADFAHDLPTRRAAVLGLLEASTAPTLAIVNLSSYATRYRAKLAKAGVSPDRVSVDSFMRAAARTDLAHFERLIYVEHPIAATYRGMDIEARMAADAEAVHVVAAPRVETFLYDRYRAEIDSVAQLTQALREVCPVWQSSIRT